MELALENNETYPSNLQVYSQQYFSLLTLQESASTYQALLIQ